ncbi:MAG TPA: hypothetical protein VMF29_00890, partial [Candidatus Edwardsbacteria bacterium]|nr:hypothetical protein [Candidatus Edwardsbacteria bacterium]
MFLRRRVELIGAGILLALAATLAAFFFGQVPDRAYLAYRYARDLATGRGLVYNFGQPAFLSGSVSAPYALLLGVAMLIVPDVPSLAALLGLAAIDASAVIVARLAATTGRLPSLLAAGMVAVFPLMWSGLGTET